MLSCPLIITLRVMAGQFLHGVLRDVWLSILGNLCAGCFHGEIMAEDVAMQIGALVWDYQDSSITEVVVGAQHSGIILNHCHNTSDKAFSK